MKKLIIAMTLMMTLLLAAGCSGEQSQMDYIGAETAKEVAVTTAGYAASSVSFTTAELAEKDGTNYYEIVFTVNGETYEFCIDALTGVVIDSNVPADSISITAKTDETTVEESTAVETVAETTEESQTAAESSTGTDAAAEASTGTTADNSTTGTTGATGTTSTDITSDEAMTIALNYAGVTADQVTVTKNKLDTEHGQQVYDIEFYLTNATHHTEYDFEISVSTGEVLSYSYDCDHHSTSTSTVTLTADEAKEMALAQVPGATTSNITEFETDYDDGRTVYEGKIVYNGVEYEFEIDGYSGAFLGWESEKR